MSDIVLSNEEITELTGYKWPAKQLARLQKAGFVRSWIGPHKKVILPRAHFEAVRAGTYGKPRPTEPVYERIPAPLHWRERPEHQERIRAEKLAYAEEAKRRAQQDAEAAVRLAAYKAEMDRTRPERRAALVRHHAAKRRVAKLQRTPPWANQDAIRAIYAEAVRLTRETGIEHHVDHTIPLQGELVSGLHVENNLQVLPWRENILKRNRFEVE